MPNLKHLLSALFASTLQQNKIHTIITPSALLQKNLQKQTSFPHLIKKSDFRLSGKSLLYPYNKFLMVMKKQKPVDKIFFCFYL